MVYTCNAFLIYNLMHFNAFLVCKFLSTNIYHYFFGRRGVSEHDRNPFCRYTDTETLLTTVSYLFINKLNEDT